MRELLVVWHGGERNKVSYIATSDERIWTTSNVNEATVFTDEDEAFKHRLSPSYAVVEKDVYLRSRSGKLAENATDQESRICFGIIWFETEEEAIEYGQLMNALGVTYNGGFYHGMPCGRDSTWDNEKGFASTH